MELYLKTVHELRDLMIKKEVSSEEITKSYFERIKAVESKVDAYITLNEEEALNEAQAVDRRRMNNELLPPLAGIPAAVKDNICTKGLKTTCASKILENFIPPYNATVVEKLNAQQIVTIGKTNMDEFAMGSSTENSYFKKTKNPWNLECVPGGSSGGSAACVAADEAAFSLGSDTGGSIRQPAHFCGVVGMKPTYGSVSRFGLVAFASSLDQIGPLTKDVEDMALVLNTIMGHDKMDSTSVPMEYEDMTKSLVNDVKGMKVALPKEFFGKGIQEDVKNAVLAAAKQLESMGAIIDEVSMKIIDYALPAYYLVSSAEASSNLARYDGVKYGHRAQNYKDLLDLYKQTRDEGFGKEVKRRIILGTYALSSGYYDAYYKKAQQVRTVIKNDFDSIFNNFDIILTPVAPTTAFKIGEKTSDPLEMYLGDICTVPVNIAGLPSLSINCGFDSNGLPIGMQLIGKAFQEGQLIRAAYSYEQSQKNLLRRPKL